MHKFLKYWDNFIIISCYWSFAQSCLTLWDPMDCSMPGFPVLHHLPEFVWIHVHWVVMPSNHLVLCQPLILLPLIFPGIRVFSNESALCIRWPKYWSFSFCISPSNEYSRLISFRIEWFDLHEVQGTLKILLQHNLKASVLQRSAFFMAQLSHLYMTTGKTIALTRRTFVGKVIYLCFLIYCLGLSLFLSSIGEGNGNPPQCSCLENPRDVGAW